MRRAQNEGVLPHTPPARIASGSFPTPIQHVVVIVQLGRSFNNLFNGFPGAYTVQVDPFTGTPIAQRLIEDPCDPGHQHQDFVNAYDSGKMDGFQKTPCSAYSAVPQSETTYYWGLASKYGFAVNTMQPTQGAAGPSHLELVAGQAGRPLELAEDGSKIGGLSSDDFTCSNMSALTPEIDLTQPYPGNENNSGVPCLSVPTIFDELETAGLTWNYYCDSTMQEWQAPLSFSQIYNSPSRRAHVIMPSANFLTDIAAGTFANVTYISPAPGSSDDPLHDECSNCGENWVQSIIQAVQGSPYWNSTAIFLLWDHSGMWYDPIVPTIRDSYHTGFRVPLVVISPFSKPGYIDRTQRTTLSVLRFIEDAFNLPLLGEFDVLEPDDLFQFFDPLTVGMRRHRPEHGRALASALSMSAKSAVR